MDRAVLEWVERRIEEEVFATANDLKPIPKQVQSRFLFLRFREYTRRQFVETAIQVLRNKSV